jgi:hypothetical protein
MCALKGRWTISGIPAGMQFLFWFAYSGGYTTG